MDPRHPEHQADHRSSRLEPLPRVVDWATARDLDAGGCVHVDIDGYNGAVARAGCWASFLNFGIGLFGLQAVLQEELAIRAVLGAFTACIIVARVVVARRRPDIDNYVRRGA